MWPSLSAVSGTRPIVPPMASHATPRTPPAAAAPRPVPLPRTWSFGGTEIVAVLVAIAIVILGMWLRHDGLDQLSTLGGTLTAIGQLTGLYRDLPRAHPARADVAQPVARPGLRHGRPGRAHRWLGFATVWLLLAHVVFITTGYAARRRQQRRRGVLDAHHDLSVRADGARSVAGCSRWSRSARSERRGAALSYETWYGLHLYAYLAIALGFLHQLFVGADFIHDPIAVGYWVALYVVTVALILVFRIGQPVWLSARHRLRVSNIVTEAPGRHLDLRDRAASSISLAVRSGQYFVWRFLTRDGWWRGHPFSISSAPNGAVAADHDQGAGRLVEGAPARLGRDAGLHRGSVRRPDGRAADAAQGPAHRRRDRHHPAARAARGTAGRAWRHDPAVPRPQPGRRHLPRRARALARRAAHGSTTWSGPRRPADDPLDAPSLARLVPDIAERDVYLCGPVPMMQRVEASLRHLGLPPERVHAERFAY